MRGRESIPAEEKLEAPRTRLGWDQNRFLLPVVGTDRYPFREWMGGASGVETQNRFRLLVGTDRF